MVFMPHWPKPLGFRPTDFSLIRIHDVLEKLGNPEKKMPPAIHVAGTNGKGSTIAFLNSVLHSAGYKAHIYTSPHLVEFNERIVLSGSKISDINLYNTLEEVRLASEGIPITFFEGTTIAAFLAFSRINADVCIIETGMGGRLDATNVIRPIMSIITSISLEHTGFLGPTVEIIAGEKCGIMKEGITCIVSPQQSSVMQVIESYAIRNHSPIYRGGIDWFSYRSSHHMIFETNLYKIELPLPNLKGNHQIINAGNAIAACTVLSGKYNYDLDEEHIYNGLTNAYWPARIEKIEKIPLPEKWQLFLDGAHNPSGAEVLSSWIDDNFDIHDLHFIVGMTRDKDSQSFLLHLKPYIRTLYTVCVKSEPRSQPSEELAQTAAQMGINAKACDSITDAINAILKCNQNKQNQTIIVCGSLFLAGDLHKTYST